MRMRQKVSISQLPIRLGIFLLLYLVPQSLSAQENNDSTHILRNGASITPDDVLKQANINLFPEKSTTYSLYSPGQLEHIPRFSLKRDISLPYQTNPSLLFRGDYSTGGVLHQFDRGALFGSGSQTSMAGIGRFNSASLGYQHIFNEQFELQVRANALKVNMSHITGQAFSTSGAFLYHPSDRVTLKVFGSYDIRNSYGMSTHSFRFHSLSPAPACFRQSQTHSHSQIHQSRKFHLQTHNTAIFSSPCLTPSFSSVRPGSSRLRLREAGSVL